MRLLMACTAIGLALSLNGALAQTTVDPARGSRRRLRRRPAVV